MKVLSIVGNRPQFVKAAPVSRALRAVCDEVLVDTGQHYDRALAGVFYDQLGLPAPDHALGIGAAGLSHAHQTERMLVGVDAVLEAEAPDWVVVYGDTNSTLAGALAAAKRQIPVAHVEAGLRSGDRAMPEEINRICADHLSARLFCPVDGAVATLQREGLGDREILPVGDVMYDVALALGAAAEASPILADLRLTPGTYAVATVHRAANTDDPAALARLVDGLAAVGRERLPVVLPLHPRTAAALTRDRLVPRLAPPGVRLIAPLGYVEFTALLRGARVCLTDSGGVQKEAYFAGVPCVTLRTTTEWTETVDAGWNRLSATDPASLLASVAAALAPPPGARPPLYGDGHAADRIAAAFAS